ncbi:MAG TPA: HIG1 domain-containing protein [Crenalkalicoccus sp.]|nr:HIG1 domain-containing protein [Crenalkalicoccus sp.]
MQTILAVLVVFGLVATLGVLFAGMVGVVRNDGNGQRSNMLMRWRVVLQGVTLLLFALLLLTLRH